ncbi:MAG: ABC transporter permease [Proteobacteria bacterium]|nr:ABC transporter permease [Pseudomonadota bacterium]
MGNQGASDDRKQDRRERSVGAEIARGVVLVFAPLLGFLGSLGEHLILLARAVRWLFRRPFRRHLFLDACEYIGVSSLPIITLVGAFTGMVTALQAVFQLKRFGMEAMAGSAAGLGLSTELGPVLTALMLAGRAGSGIATEIGTMRISEQIDALETMAVSPVQYLVTPRVVGGVIMGPVLTCIFFGVGMAGAYLVAVKLHGVDHGLFVSNLRTSLMPIHLVQGVIKAAVFGLCFSLIGCFQGYRASGGGRGVGMATTRAVVIGSVTILILDYFITDLMLPFMPQLAM